MQRLGRKETIMTQELVDMIQDLVRPGDIILSYEAQRFTSMFIKGNYDHASISTNKATIMEAVGDMFVHNYADDGMTNMGGVREVPLEEWLYKKDHVAIVRVKFNEENRLAAGEFSRSFAGLGYDYAFDINNKKVYCSELILLTYRKIVPQFLEEIDGEILPIDYMNFTQSKPDLFELIFDSRKELK